jgi:two-component system cell cycle sensor histidine kinase/response regulator CckA
MIPPKNIFPRWMISALVMLMLFLVAGGAWFFHHEKQTAYQQAQEQFSAIAQLKIRQIINWRQERLAGAAVLTESFFLSQGIARFLEDPSLQHTEQLRRRLQSIQDQYHYADIFLVDPDGRVRLSLNSDAQAGDNFAAMATEALQTRHPIMSDLHIDAQRPQPHLNLIAPIFSFTATGQTSSPLGAIILIYDAEQFLYPLIQDWPTPSKSAETILVRRDGDSVLFLNELRHRAGAAFNLRIPLTRTDVPAVMAVLGKEGFVEGVDHRGVKSVAVVLPVPDSPWYMVAKADATEVFSGWNSQAGMILLVLAALTVSIGAIFLFAWQRHQKTHYRALYLAESKLRASVERHSITLKAVGDGIVSVNVQGQIELLNPVAEKLTGWTQAEALGRPVEEIFHVINEQTRKRGEDLVARVLREGLTIALANHSLLVDKNGKEHPIADSAAPIRDEQGNIHGVVIVFRDQTIERRTFSLIQKRLTLFEYANTHTLDEFLVKTLDEVSAFVNSPIGFYHFVDPDQKNLILQQWSTRTLQEFCQAEGRGMHYGIDQAGVWVDCVHAGRPVVHNDYATLPHKKGLPPGHAEIIRELVVPVQRDGKVVAILGVGNKPEPYTDIDVDVVAHLADVTWEFIQEKHNKERLHASEQRYRTLYQGMRDAFVITDLDGNISDFNTAYQAMMGYPEEELRTFHSTDITPEKWHALERTIVQEQVLPHGYSSLYEKEYRRKDGTIFPAELRVMLLLDDDGRPSGMSAIVRDISERKQAEEERGKLQAQLFQAQRMESIGRLAGGVAHDFNNMLSIILGYGEMVLKKLPGTDPLRHPLQEIFNAGQRSAAITRQLLAFARKQTIAPRVLDLNDTVESMLKMLRRLIGEDINLAWLPGSELKPVRIDPSQLDQILANLCINARDAIADVGRISIETGQAVFDEAYCADHPGFLPGEYIRLAVSDDGCGMDKETLNNIFEPFFTTKQEGQGTGLGLSTVYGIVDQNRGFINVYSEPGKGTIFRIYLPVYLTDAAESLARAAVEPPRGHGETIFVVEDEAAICDMTKTMLENHGYTVLTALSPEQALAMVPSSDDTIQLLLTDVIMPGMNGRELSEQLTKQHPGLKTLFISGYTADTIGHLGILEPGMHFLHKPFSSTDLAIKVHEILHGNAK